MPALPARCVQAGAPTVPLHTSGVQTLPSLVHAVPAALTASAGQLPLLPGQVSARSHSFVAARQTVAAGTKRHAAEQQEPGVPFEAA